MNEVKIIYCYDENKNAVHYSKTIKGRVYYCIDCGSELYCRGGENKKVIKHLSHKNTANCGGTGESIFHKHWKENLFKAGMFINIANKLEEPKNIEIIDVINEVSLNQRYNTDWDIEIIVDTLLVTEIGDIVVEINYTNPKDWILLSKYYNELDLLRVYEVKVDKTINTQLEWSYLGEDDETKQIEERMREEDRRRIQEQKIKQELIKQQRKLNKETEKQKREEKKRQLELEKERIKTQNLKSGVWEIKEIYLNFKTPLADYTDDIKKLKCLYKEDTVFKPIKLVFDFCKTDLGIRNTKSNFAITKGIVNCKVVVESKTNKDGSYNVVGYYISKPYSYDRSLYAQLCNVI